LLNSKRPRLLDSATLIGQPTNLVRKRHTGGRITVDHPQALGLGAHDDVAIAVAGALILASERDPEDAGLTFSRQASSTSCCPVCLGRGQLGTGSLEALMMACYLCSGGTSRV
jgi:hypothetical protein